MTEILLFIGLGYVVLGPQRMHAIVQKIARAKREFHNTREELVSQLSSSMPSESKEPET